MTKEERQANDELYEKLMNGKLEDLPVSGFSEGEFLIDSRDLQILWEQRNKKK